MTILSRTIKEIFRSNKKNAKNSEAGGVVFQTQAVRQAEGGSIICFAGVSEGDALANLTREYAEPFLKLASRVLILDISSPKFVEELNSALGEPIWFAYSFFAVGQDVDLIINGLEQNLWEAFGIPFIRIFGDIPAYFPDRHIRKYTNSINAYGAKSHQDFYKRWFDDAALTVLFPPFPIETRPLDEIDVDLKIRGKIIFPKNGNSPNALIKYWRESIPKSVSDVLQAVAEECIDRKNINDEPKIDDRLIEHYFEMGIDISADRPLLCYLVAQIDDYVRRVKSTMIAEAIMDLPVVIRGVNWEHVNFYGKRAQFEGRSDFANTRQLIDAAPAMIDMSPNTYFTPHDRIVRATGRGTAFLTNHQEFIGKILELPEKCSFCFDIDNIRDLVEYYVLNPKEAVNLGLQQATGFRKFYTVEKHAQVLLAAVDAMTLRLRGRPTGTQDFVDFPPKEFL